MNGLKFGVSSECAQDTKSCQGNAQPWKVAKKHHVSEIVASGGNVRGKVKMCRLIKTQHTHTVAAAVKIQRCAQIHAQAV